MPFNFKQQQQQKKKPSFYQQQQGQQQQQQQQKQKPMMQQQQEPAEQEEQAKMIGFAEDEVVFIENVLVELEELVPNDQGENTEILEKIITAQQIVTARLDSEAGMIGDSA